jgi:hypothetical protein
MAACYERFGPSEREFSGSLCLHQTEYGTFGPKFGLGTSGWGAMI